MSPRSPPPRVRADIVFIYRAAARWGASPSAARAAGAGQGVGPGGGGAFQEVAQGGRQPLAEALAALVAFGHGAHGDAAALGRLHQQLLVHEVDSQGPGGGLAHLPRAAGYVARHGHDGHLSPPFLLTPSASPAPRRRASSVYLSDASCQ